MEWNGTLGYAAGLVSGSLGTTLLNHWLGTRRDEKQAERDRQAEEVAGAREVERQRIVDQRSRDVARLLVIRNGAHELSKLAVKAFVRQMDSPSDLERELHLPADLSADVSRAASELSDPTIQRRWFGLAACLYSSEYNYKSIADNPTALWERYMEYSDLHDVFIDKLNTLERTL